VLVFLNCLFSKNSRVCSVHDAKCPRLLNCLICSLATPQAVLQRFIAVPRSTLRACLVYNKYMDNFMLFVHRLVSTCFFGVSVLSVLLLVSLS